MESSLYGLTLRAFGGLECGIKGHMTGSVLYRTRGLNIDSNT